MKKIWITGAEGHIGTALIDLLEGVEYQLLPTDINEVDITKIDEVTQFVHVNRPDVVINCAGLTDVQECENNVDEAYRVNAIGVRNVALAANEVNAKVIQISTDDVFDKESRIPYNEFDNVHPRTIYGKSKEAGEKILTQLLNRFVIIRSSWIYGILLIMKNMVCIMWSAREAAADMNLQERSLSIPEKPENWICIRL